VIDFYPGAHIQIQIKKRPHKQLFWRRANPPLIPIYVFLPLSLLLKTELSMKRVIQAPLYYFLKGVFGFAIKSEYDIQSRFE
jgi:hypothetical protein